MIDDGKRVAAGGTRFQWHMLTIADIELIARNTEAEENRVKLLRPPRHAVTGSFRAGELPFRSVERNKTICAKAFIGYVTRLPHPFTAWFAEFIRWHEPDGL
jgi:hypothetical protein